MNSKKKKIFVHQDTIKTMNKQATGQDKMFTTHISDKELISRMYSKFSLNFIDGLLKTDTLFSFTIG